MNDNQKILSKNINKLNDSLEVNYKRNTLKDYILNNKLYISINTNLEKTCIDDYKISINGYGRRIYILPNYIKGHMEDSTITLKLDNNIADEIKRIIANEFFN